MTTESIPTMADFKWSLTTAPRPGEAQDDGDGWCVRDAFCELLGWPPHSFDWSRFIEWPNGADLLRLATYLGLKKLRVPEDWNELIRLSVHPGVTHFIFSAASAAQKAHVVYTPDIQWLLHHWPEPNGKPIPPGTRWPLKYGWPLVNPRHLALDPTLVTIFVESGNLRTPRDRDQRG